MVTPTEDFEFIGRKGWMIHPRIFTMSPQYDIFSSDRVRYREDYDIEFIDGSFGQSDCTSGYENTLDVMKNSFIRIRYSNRFYE